MRHIHERTETIMEIKLTNGTMSASINTFAAEMKSLRDENGNEYIWDGSDYWKRSAPFLFPLVGGLRNDTVIIKGQEYHMKQHGFARDKEWTVEKAEGNTATLTLSQDEDTLSKYPYPFTLSLTYTLVDHTMKMAFTVRNTGDEVMPFCFGTHPAIRCPFTSSPDSKFTDYSIVFEKDEILTQPIFNEKKELDRVNRGSFMADSKTIKLDYAVFEKIDTIVFDEIHSHKVDLVDGVTGKSVQVRFDDFTQMGFWTPKAGAPFVCIEPWNGCAIVADADDKFESKLGVRMLEPGKEKTFTLEIDVKGCI